MLVRVAEADRLVELIVFLRNSGFPLARRESEGIAKLFSEDESRVRATIALWETRYGVKVDIVAEPSEDDQPS